MGQRKSFVVVLVNSLRILISSQLFRYVDFEKWTTLKIGMGDTEVK